MSIPWCALQFMWRMSKKGGPACSTKHLRNRQSSKLDLPMPNRRRKVKSSSCEMAELRCLFKWEFIIESLMSTKFSTTGKFTLSSYSHITKNRKKKSAMEWFSRSTWIYSWQDPLCLPVKPASQEAETGRQPCGSKPELLNGAITNFWASFVHHEQYQDGRQW